MSIDVRPPKTKIRVPLGDDFVLTLRFKLDGRATSRVGSSFLGQIRVDATDSEDVGEFVFDTSEASSGIIRASLAAEVTGTLDAELEYVWDIEETDIAGVKRTKAGGTIEFEQDVSRAA